MEKVDGFGQCFICSCLSTISALKDNEGKIIPETKKCEDCQ